MERFYLDLRKIKFSSQGGLITITVLLLVMIVLCYFFMRNPYRKVHEQIFQTADNIRSYYADRPGYWKLSTKSAIDDRLIAEDLLEQKDFKINIGEGAEGDMAMPSDNDFDISLGGLNKSFCIGLTEATINNNRQLSLQKITIINKKGTTEFAWGDEDHPLPIKKFSMRNVCMPTDNKILWTFH